MIYASKESRRTQIAFLILSSAIFNSFSNLLYLDNSRAEISACKPNVKLFHLLGSSSLHVNSPIMYCNLSVLKLPTILVLLLNLWPAVWISLRHLTTFYPFLAIFPSSRSRISHFFCAFWGLASLYKTTKRLTQSILLHGMAHLVKGTV